MTRIAAAVLACLVALVANAQPNPQKWTRITGPKDSAANEVSLARTGDGVLHVAWVRAADGTAAVLHSVIAPDGSVRADAQPVVDGWKTLSVPALLVEPDGTLRAVFGGVLGTLSTSDPYNAGSLYSATSGADGARWSLAAGMLSDAQNVYVGPVAAVMNRNGTVATAWAASDQLHAQIGLVAGKGRQRLQQSCCPYQPGLGADGVSGEMLVAWYSNDDARLGVHAQMIAPALKDAVRVPGSVVAWEGRTRSISIDQRIPVSGRVGAPGLYVAFCAGYPTLKTVNLWRYGDSQPLQLAKLTTGRTASVTAGPEGRLWVMWANAGRFFAARSNRAASRFSAPIAVPPPAGLDAIYRVTGEGTPGPLDLLAHVSTSGTGSATWHTRVYPILEVTVTPRSVPAAQGGTVTIAVTDVGDPVAGATLTMPGAAVKTGPDGRATFDLPKGGKPGPIQISVRADGYRPGKTSVTVK